MTYKSEKNAFVKKTGKSIIIELKTRAYEMKYRD